ncbi:MAG: hypothetical protein WA012_01210 [Rhodoferax sp.]|uniref:hypothetical protein n=1 Tax=Rhodoferax sp. TaxID=50421 RepID=UPI003BAFD1E6
MDCFTLVRNDEISRSLMTFQALKRHANPVDGLFHARPGRYLQPQFAGNVVDHRRVQRQAADVDGGNQVLGALLRRQRPAAGQEFLESVHGLFACLRWGAIVSNIVQTLAVRKFLAPQLSLRTPVRPQRSLQ